MSAPGAGPRPGPAPVGVSERGSGPSFLVKCRIIGIALLGAAVLCGCSAVRVGYNQAPTLAWWWLDGWVDFDAAQSPKVKDAVAQWFAWHRRTQLPDYAQLLAAAAAQVQQPATAAQACRWQDELRARAETALLQGAALAADAAPLLGQAQLPRLERRYRKSNQDFRDDFLQPDPDARLQAAVQRTADRAEMLYGRLDEAQLQLIAAGVEASPFDPAAWLAERERVQAQALQTLAALGAGGAARADRDTARAALQALALRWLHPPPGPYRNYQQQLAAYNCEFVARLHNTTTPAQRRHARDRLRTWEEDVRALAAQKPAPAGAAMPQQL